MKIKVEGLSDTPLLLTAREPVSEFPALAKLDENGECRFLGPLHLDFTIAREFDHIRAHGHVETKVRFTCSRCLAEYDAGLSTEFTIFYSKTSRVPVEEEVALSEEDLVSVSYEGDTIDFTNEVEGQVLMEIPLKPLCSEGCKGLCSTCGMDLNTGECGCARSGSSFTFSALKDFTVKK